MSADKVVIAILFVKILFKLAMTVLFNFFYINLFPMSLKVNFQNFSNINVKLLF